MQSSQEILQKQKSPYDHMRVNSKTHMTYGSDKYDEAVDDFKHLRADETYRKLHIFHARRIGCDKYIQLARTAEQEGKNPARYFSYLLKKEIT